MNLTISALIMISSYSTERVSRKRGLFSEYSASAPGHSTFISHFSSSTHISPLSFPIFPSSTMPDAQQLKMVRVEIKGVVQGVCYRDWTVENASKLGLNGWVRNRADGSVEAVFSGNVDKVDDMEQLCRSGPSGAMVTSLSSFPCYEDPGSGFQRRPTI